MKKLVISLSLAFCLVQAQAQSAASANWALLAAPDNAVVSGQITADAISMSGLVHNAYNATYGKQVTLATGVYPQASDPNLYIQFSVAPKSGFDFTLDQLSFYICGNSSNLMRADFYYSTDATFATKTQIMQYNDIPVPRDNTTGPGLVSLTSMNLKVADGQHVYLRIYPFNETADQNSGRRIYLKDLTFAGTTAAAGTTSVKENVLNALNCYKADNRIYIQGLTGTNNIQVFDISGKLIVSTEVQNDDYAAEVGQSLVIVKITNKETKDTKVVKLF